MGQKSMPVKEPRHHLLLGDFLAIALCARVSSNRLLGGVGNLSTRAEFVSRAGGKHSCSEAPGSPSTMTGITCSAPPLALKWRISSLTYLLCAAFGEQITIKNFAASNAASVWAVRECPAEKSSRSRKIGRSVLGTEPTGVSGPTKSLSIR